MGEELQLMRCIRPGTHEMLERLSPDYDIVFWSAVFHMLVKSKIYHMGIEDTKLSYKVIDVLDESMMFRLSESAKRNPRKGVSVKPLKLLYDRYGYNPHN